MSDAYMDADGPSWKTVMMHPNYGAVLLKQSAALFRKYEANHRATAQQYDPKKLTLDTHPDMIEAYTSQHKSSTEKADVNKEQAERIERFLAGEIPNGQ